MKPARRRRRRSRSAILAERTIIDIKQKERAFLREVSTILSDALGFPVKVSHVKVQFATTPDMRRASRLTKREVRRQLADAMQAPVIPGDGARR